jgi:hypothetical protein
MDPAQRPPKETLHELMFRRFKKTLQVMYDLEYYKRVETDDPTKNKHVQPYKWIRKRLANYVAREDQQNVGKD